MRASRLLLLLALAACGGAQNCTLIGCVSQLTVRLPPGVTQATACVAGVCTSEVAQGALQVPLGRRSEGETALLTVTVAGREEPYEGQVPLVRSRPNGPRCPPVCVTGQAVLDATSGQVL